MADMALKAQLQDAAADNTGGLARAAWLTQMTSDEKAGPFRNILAALCETVDQLRENLAHQMRFETWNQPGAGYDLTGGCNAQKMSGVRRIECVDLPTVGALQRMPATLADIDLMAQLEVLIELLSIAHTVCGINDVNLEHRGVLMDEDKEHAPPAGAIL